MHTNCLLGGLEDYLEEHTDICILVYDVRIN